MIRVGRAAKRIGVHRVRDIPPRDPASLEIEAGEADIVLVGDRRQIRGADGLDPNEIGPFVHGQHELAGERPESHSRERDLEPGAVRRESAALDVIDGVGTTDLVG